MLVSCRLLRGACATKSDVAVEGSAGALDSAAIYMPYMQCELDVSHLVRQESRFIECPSEMHDPTNG
jgi:hypothetical protein